MSSTNLNERDSDNQKNLGNNTTSPNISIS